MSNWCWSEGLNCLWCHWSGKVSICSQPRKQSSWGQHGAHLGPVGPRWAPCWPHKPCYQGTLHGHSSLPSMGDLIVIQLHLQHCWDSPLSLMFCLNKAWHMVNMRLCLANLIWNVQNINYRMVWSRLNSRLLWYQSQQFHKLFFVLYLYVNGLYSCILSKVLDVTFGLYNSKIISVAHHMAVVTSMLKHWICLSLVLRF